MVKNLDNLNLSTPEQSKGGGGSKFTGYDRYMTFL